LLRAAALVACLALVAASVSACETTQEKATKQQARAAHILKARAERHQKKERQKAKKHHQEGSSK
jgi:outer membrane lipoprotein-sorting protein